MKHFRIAVNGTSYDVEVTELDGAVSAAAAPISGSQTRLCGRRDRALRDPPEGGRRPQYARVQACFQPAQKARELPRLTLGGTGYA